MKLTTAQKWLRTIAWLRRNFPTASIVRVQSIPMEIHGVCCYEKKKFLITINRKKSFGLRIDTIIHEWAHALTWFGAETDVEEHSAEWGIQYAKIYRTFIEWNFGREEELEE